MAPYTEIACGIYLLKCGYDGSWKKGLIAHLFVKFFCNSGFPESWLYGEAQSCMKMVDIMNQLSLFVATIYSTTNNEKCVRTMCGYFLKVEWSKDACHNESFSDKATLKNSEEFQCTSVGFS